MMELVRTGQTRRSVAEELGRTEFSVQSMISLVRNGGGPRRKTIVPPAPRENPYMVMDGRVSVGDPDRLLRALFREHVAPRADIFGESAGGAA